MNMATPLPSLDLGDPTWCCTGTACCGVFVIGLAVFVILLYWFTLWFGWRAVNSLSIFRKK